MTSGSASTPQFANTRWSLVAALGDGSDSQAPLLELCLHNWYPVYSYLRHSGHSPEGAQELTRSFFHHLMTSGASHAGATRYGRFRQFLLAELHLFLAQERSVGLVTTPIAPMSIDQLESRQRKDTTPANSPEQALRRGFALEIIDGALRSLRSEAREADRLAMFDLLQRFLTTDPLPGEFEQAAQQLAVRPVFVVMAVKRMRERFRELVDVELGDTVLNTDELSAERQALLEALARDGT